MARIQFTSEVDEILGRLAGSVFQDSYGGYQVRGLNTPRNPQTQLQQLRRGDFRFLAAGWRNLTTIEKQTWINSAGTVPEALRLYIGNNINLILVGIPIISSYVPGVTPGAFPLQITSVDPTAFIIQAADEPTVVPDGQRMLLYATTDKFPTRIFNNPSEYEPIEFFLPGEDLATPTDVITAWTSKYGVMRLNRLICIKSLLIDETNGNRGEDSIVCAISSIMERFGIEDNSSDQNRAFALNDFNFTLTAQGDTAASYIFEVLNSDSTQISELELFPGGFALEALDTADDIITSLQTTSQGLQIGAVQESTTVGSYIFVQQPKIEFQSANYQFNDVQEYADNAAAIAAGLFIGCVYRTGDLLKIVHA